MENGEFEKWLEATEDELARAEDNRRTGQIVVRMARYWIAHQWNPHNKREEEARAEIKRFIWGVRLAFWLIGGMVAVVVWALDTAVDLITLTRLGAGGP